MAQAGSPMREQTVETRTTEVNISTYRLDFSDEMGGGRAFVTETTVTGDHGEKINVLPPIISETRQEMTQTEAGIREYIDKNDARIELLPYEASGLEKDHGYANVFAEETRYGELGGYVNFDADTYSEYGYQGTVVIDVNATPTTGATVDALEFRPADIKITPDGELTGPAIDTIEKYVSDEGALREGIEENIELNDLRLPENARDTVAEVYNENGYYPQNIVDEYLNTLADAAETYRETGMDINDRDDAESGKDETPWYLTDEYGDIDDYALDIYNDLVDAETDRTLVPSIYSQNDRIETDYGLANVHTAVYNHEDAEYEGDHDHVVGTVTTITLSESTNNPIVIRVEFNDNIEGANANHEKALDTLRNPDELKEAIANRLEERYGSADMARSKLDDMEDRQADRLVTLGRVPGVEVEVVITDKMNHEIKVDGGTVRIEGIQEILYERDEGIRVTFEEADGIVHELGEIECGPDEAARVESFFISNTDIIDYIEDHPDRLNEIAFDDNVDSADKPEFGTVGSIEYAYGDGTTFNNEEDMEALTGAFDENGSLDEIFDKFEQQEDAQEDIEAGSTGTGSIEKTEDDGINEGVDAVNADTDIDPDNTDIQDDDGSDPVD